jgi:hypothetical protein
MSRLRSRKLLLSLKNGTIESCFSVPMLQLTLGHMPFAIGFAVTALGWDGWRVGGLAATPFLAFVAQVPVSFVLQRFLSLREMCRVSFLVNALPWFLVVLFPYLDPGPRDALFAAIAFTSALGNAVASVAWSAAVSDLVPLPIRGRYFGRRNLVYGFWTLVTLLAAGQVADATGNSLRVFGALYALAATSRLVGLRFFSRMEFPASVTQRRGDVARLSGLLVPLGDANFRWLLAWNGLFGLFLFGGLPFYSVYVLRGLRFTLGDLTIMTSLANLAGLASVNTWAPLTDRFGVKPVLTGAVALWAVTGAALWLLTGPETRLLAYPGYLVYGFMWTLVQLLQFTFMIKMAPDVHRTHYISTYYAFTYLLTFMGPFLGGALLGRLPPETGRVLGRPLTPYHVVLVGSLVLCAATLLLLRRVHEPASGSLREMVRHMTRSVETNPVLLLVSVAQELFGGRAFATVLRQSRRALHRQTNLLGAVGEELAEESLRALRYPFRPAERPVAGADSGSSPPEIPTRGRGRPERD